MANTELASRSDQHLTESSFVYYPHGIDLLPSEKPSETAIDQVFEIKSFRALMQETTSGFAIGPRLTNALFLPWHAGRNTGGRPDGFFFDDNFQLTELWEFRNRKAGGNRYAEKIKRLEIFVDYVREHHRQFRQRLQSIPSSLSIPLEIYIPPVEQISIVFITRTGQLPAGNSLETRFQSISQRLLLHRPIGEPATTAGVGD